MAGLNWIRSKTRARLLYFIWWWVDNASSERDRQVLGRCSPFDAIQSCSPPRHLLGINESADNVLLTHFKSRKDNTIVLFDVFYTRSWWTEFDTLNNPNLGITALDFTRGLGTIELDRSEAEAEATQKKFSVQFVYAPDEKKRKKEAHWWILLHKYCREHCRSAVLSFVPTYHWYKANQYSEWLNHIMVQLRLRI